MLERIEEGFGVEGRGLMELMKNGGELNMVYRSEYFEACVDGVKE